MSFALLISSHPHLILLPDLILKKKKKNVLFGAHLGLVVGEVLRLCCWKSASHTEADIVHGVVFYSAAFPSLLC